MELIEISNKNFILDERGYKDKHYLYTNTLEKQIVLKYLYKYLNDNKYSDEAFDYLKKRLGIKKNPLKKCIREYATKYIGIPDEYFKASYSTKTKIAKIDERRFNSILYKIYEGIIPMYTKESAYEYVKNTHYDPYYLRNNFSKYEDLYNDFKREVIRTRLDIVCKYKKELNKPVLSDENLIKKEEEINHKARVMITVYNYSGSIDINEFCRYYGTTIKEFNNAVDIVKISDEILYNRYLIARKNNEKAVENYLKNSIVDLSILIKNKVDDNGKLREFDILDYFKTTSLPLNQVLNMSFKYLNRADQKELRDKLQRYTKLNVFETSDDDIKHILDEVVIVGAEFDKRGKMIEGSGTLISKELKEKLISYLRDNGYPINKVTYKALFKRYNNGFINLNEKNKNVKRYILEK